MKQCPPCTGSCNQGRLCTAPVEPAFWDFTPLEILYAAIVIVVTIVASALV